jgi:lipooligosaccharide transport system permease protein
MYVRRFNKVYDAFLCTPTQIQDILVGEILWAATRGLLYGAGFLLFLGLFTMAGHPILTNLEGALFLPLAVILVALFFAAMGTFVNAVIPVIDMFSIYFTLFITPLFLFSGIFFPLTKITYGETIAWFTPLYHGVRLMRGLAQGPLTMEHAVSAVWIFVATLIVLAVATKIMRKRVFS